MDLNKQHLVIVILNWKCWTDTIECLESVYKSEYKNYHIILVDNFSDDDSIERIKGWALGDNEAQFETKFPHLVFPLIPKPIPARKRIFDEVGLLSEKFFFGEEDFEFSWRMRKHGIPVTCVLGSRVYQ